jgi:hypothetical protein
MGWAVKESWFNFWQGKEIFLFSTASTLALEPIQPPKQ